MKITQQLVSKAIQNRVTFNGVNSRKFIVIHETANTGRGAGAQNHATLQSNGNSRNASWHYQVDSKAVIQSFPDTAQCWHAGNGYYNQNGIGIEICVNSDDNFVKAVENASKLVRTLMSKYSIPISNVITHNKTSGWKDCPRYLRSGSKGVNWNQFINMVQSGNGSLPSTPSVPSTPSPSTKLGLVDWLISKNYKSDFNYRASLAKHYGISGYSGSANQNIKLLSLIVSDYSKNGSVGSSPSVPSKPQTSSDVKVGQKVTLSSSATKYATGQNIPASVKGKSYTVQQVKSDRVLLKEIYSWVYKKDIGYSGGTTSTPTTIFRVGGKVRIKSSARTYATGQNIPASVKGRTYTIQQVNPDRILLKEIYSWVRKSDLQ